jgi:Kef-type K+ transport system membrane component KefB
VARLFLVEHTPVHLLDQVADDAAAHDVFDHREEVQHRIEALGFGFFIPLFFVVSGVRFDLESLADPVQLVKVPLFLVLFVVVRGTPALLYRRHLARHEVAALALLQAAALPLLVVITQIGVSTGQMRADNAAGLVGAGLLSVVVFPIVAMVIHQRGEAVAPQERTSAQVP